MTRSRLSKPPVRPRYHAGAAKLRQLPRLSEEAPEDGLEDLDGRRGRLVFRTLIGRARGKNSPVRTYYPRGASLHRHAECFRKRRPVGYALGWIEFCLRS